MNKKLIPAYLLTFVNVLGFSILLPILPFIVESYGAPKWVFGLLITLYSSFQFIGAPFLGSLSDSVGRKPVLLISQAGTMLSWVVFLIALYLPNFPVYGFAFPLFIIAVARILDGITGGNSSVSNAYVADITTREEKSYVFGYLGGIAGLGMIIGPAIGGLTASSTFGYAGTMCASILISIITLLTIKFWLKESLPQGKRTKEKEQSILLNIFIYRRIRLLNPAPIIKLLFSMKLFFSIMMGAYISTISLFLIDLFQFDEKEMGFFMLAVGLFLAFNQAFLSKRLINKIGEFPTLILGLILSVIGVLSLTFTDNLWLFLAFYYVFNLGVSLSFPTFNALISIYADSKKQGEIMGISESINSFAMAVIPVLATALYSCIGYQLYYIISAMPFLALLVVLFGRGSYKLK